jgi:hypothetical protein
MHCGKGQVRQEGETSGQPTSRLIPEKLKPALAFLIRLPMASNPSPWYMLFSLAYMNRVRHVAHPHPNPPREEGPNVFPYA